MAGKNNLDCRQTSISRRRFLRAAGTAAGGPSLHCPVIGTGRSRQCRGQQPNYRRLYRDR
ncbi:MAG: twin-arginine translocation signal domain-containing protein [Planctomycetota bacterium]